MTIVVVTEKPSVARDIAAVLGAKLRGDGFLHGNGYAVTWAIGHLVGLPQPHEIDPHWRAWRMDSLPMLPRRWPLQVYEKTRHQFEVVRKVLHARTAERVVCATDAGREGELIFRYIYEAAGGSLPVERLWISSLTPAAIRAGFRRLKPGADYDRLGDSARGRSCADWLVGLNLSRAYSLAFDDRSGKERSTFSVGRVQTPTLAILAERERAIREFVPEDYVVLKATFSTEAESEDGERRADDPARYEGAYFRPLTDEEHEQLNKGGGACFADGDEADKESQRRDPEKDAPARRRFDPESPEVDEVLARAKQGRACVESVRNKKERMPAPRLYDLTELQRHANRLWGWSAQRTLEVAQRLYQEKKLLSYPRTDSRHLSKEVASTLGEVLDAIGDRYDGKLHPDTGRPLSRRFVDDAKVTDHHAIIPTPTPASRVSLSGDEERLYDLVCRRLLSAWHDDHVTSVTKVVTAVVTPPTAALEDAGAGVDRYSSTGKTVLEPGWKVLDLEPVRRRAAKPSDRKRGDKGGEELQALPPLSEGQPVNVEDARKEKKRTRPPKRLTDATLLTAMETAGRTLDDEELSEAMKERGLGTPATRAQILETLIERGYVERRDKQLLATEKGMQLIERVHPEVKDVALTGQWEHRLRRIERGEERVEKFLEDIEGFVTRVVSEVRQGAGAPRPPEGDGPPRAPRTAAEPARAQGPARVAASTPVPTPASTSASTSAPTSASMSASSTLARLGFSRPVPLASLDALLKAAFGFEGFRPHQREVCEATTRGEDVLLVMPTGAGKSLCYQLPGLARGRTLVVSPLIALMEDQVAKLVGAGLKADRIHSGRSSQASREACEAWANGALDYLLVAPERFSVKRFASWLGQHPPDLVAIDEAHCISQWGHDFRPDYRLLGEHIRRLRPAPVIAMTATATREVQDDIARQLGIDGARRFIHGFRRTNIGIELVELPLGQRVEATRKLLEDPARRPAIVYAPTRAAAEETAEALLQSFPAVAYHAGIDADRRDVIQRAFIAGAIDVIVATIAFGMGVDKPDVRTVVHTGLPSSIEGYYQEIGRAGRDGLPSRAVLLHSFVDVKLHQTFVERDYPEVTVLERVWRALRAEPVALEALKSQVRLPRPRNPRQPSPFDIALEKLVIHGGARVDGDTVTRGPLSSWRDSYLAQRTHKQTQLSHMRRLTEAHGCTMVQLVRHFGDQHDDGADCGVCEVCAPQGSLLRTFRKATCDEVEYAQRVLERVPVRGMVATGVLYRETGHDEGVSRDVFELVLGALARAGLVRTEAATFEKDGKEIVFLKVARTEAGSRGEVPPELLVREPVKSARAPKRKGGGRRASRAPKESAARPSQAVSPEDEGAFETLRAWRSEKARELKWRPFHVCSDRALRSLLEVRPSTLVELQSVEGIGPAKAERFGAELLAALRGVPASGKRTRPRARSATRRRART